MSNDNGLVDEYEKLQNLKKEIDEKIDKLREALIQLAQQKNTDVLFGNHQKCSIKEYEKVIYPEDKSYFLEVIRKKGLYDKFSSLNYFKLGPSILKGQVDKEIIDLIRKEKAFRVSLKDLVV